MQVKGLQVTSNRVDGLMADFSGLDKLEDIVTKVLTRLSKRDNVQANSRSMSRENFDGWFAELVRVELGKTLAIVRAKAVEKATKAGAGDASSAVLRRMYKSGDEGNINIAGNRKRLSSRDRVVPAPNGGKSGIRRMRTVKKRTEQIRKYYGPDRGFILRILENGRDVFMATPEGPTGKRSKATYGKRGSMPPRNWFFHSMKNDMELAAKQLGDTLVGAVEEWVEQEFTEST